MTDIDIRVLGRAGRITLRRPHALNALSYDMCLSIEKALDAWKDDHAVDLVIIDAEGDRAFCAGGDIQEMYDTASVGNFDYGRKFWADEYRLNAKIFDFPKPYVAFMQGFTMGGGVGVSCHGSHRIVGETSQIAMPECGIGLVPDVGGSLLLAQAPGRLGEYLGTTTARMDAPNAIYAGFADYFIPIADWPELIEALQNGGNLDLIDLAAKTDQIPSFAQLQSKIDSLFDGETAKDCANNLTLDGSDFATDAIKKMRRVSPLSASCAVEMIHRLRGSEDINRALDLEYRFTWRAAEFGDFIEGIRAAIIDKDRNPKWQHNEISEVSLADISKMLRPLGRDALKLEG